MSGITMYTPIPLLQPGTGDDTTTTPKETFQNLLKQQPNLVGDVLQNALKAAFPFTKLTDNEKQVSLQTANVVGGAVSSTIIPCLFDLTGPFTNVGDQNKFMRSALSGIRASIVTSHFPILLKQNLGGKNISGPDLQTLLDALVSAYLGVVGQLVQQSYGDTGASNDDCSTYYCNDDGIGNDLNSL